VFDEMKGVFKIALLCALFASLMVVPVGGAPVVSDVTDKDGFTITGGVYGDVARVFGSGVVAGSDVNLYWDAVKIWDGEKGMLNSSEALPNGDFEIWFVVPEAVNGLHYLWIKDVDGDDTYGPVPFTVDAMLRLTPGSGLIGDKITIKGYGFDENVDVTDITFDASSLSTNPSTPDTSDTGSWTATFNVPNKADADYDVTATDAHLRSATETFTIGPAISLDVEEGPVGTVVEVQGRGFTDDGTVDSVSLNEIDCGVLDANDLEIDGGGEVRFELVIPGVNQADRDYELIVSDDGGKDASIYFTVTDVAEIELDPGFGPQGTRVSISGVNFAPSSNVVISVEGSSVKTLQTNSGGDFDGTFTFPAVSTGTHQVVAEQEDYNIDDSKSFRVGTMIVILSPSNGPSGTLVALTGTGFTPSGEWNASMNGVALFEKESVSGDSTLFGTFNVPTLDADTYTVTTTDVDEGIKVTSTFTVTQRTQLSMEPVIFPVGYNVSLEGDYFAESDVDVEFTYYNTSDDWDMDAYHRNGAVQTDSDGGFLAWWEVPDDLSEGTYTARAEDDEGLYAEFEFQIGSSVVTIASRKPSYLGGDTVGFRIESSFKEEGSYIEIDDPDGVFMWKTDDLNTWIKDGVIYTAPLYTQTAGGHPMILEDDATEGTWTWTWYNSDDDEISSGSFVVSAESDDQPPDDEPPDDVIPDGEEGDLLEELQKIKTDIAQYQSDLEELLSTVEGMSLSEVAGDVSEIWAEIAGMTAKVDEAKQLSEQANENVESMRDEVERVSNAAKTQSYIAYAAVGLSLLAIALGFLGPIQVTRRPV
jgi:hypothetical protein